MGVGSFLFLEPDSAPSSCPSTSALNSSPNSCKYNSCKASGRSRSASKVVFCLTRALSMRLWDMDLKESSWTPWAMRSLNSRRHSRDVYAGDVFMPQYPPRQRSRGLLWLDTRCWGATTRSVPPLTESRSKGRFNSRQDADRYDQCC